MAKIFLLHWNEAEAKQRAAVLCDAGHDVLLHWSTQSSPPLKDSLPDVAVISLDRLPSHGRAVAEWLWEAKKRQTIPIIFAGGEPSKIDATRAKFPKALYCSTASVVGAVTKLAQLRSSTDKSATSRLRHAPGADAVVKPTSTASRKTKAKQRRRAGRH